VAPDALLLGAIGHRLAHVSLLGVIARLPYEFTAWPEAALALIGLAVRERGRREGDDVVVELGADLIARAVDASDDVPA
jgi:hypothetical protein